MLTTNPSFLQQDKGTSPPFFLEIINAYYLNILRPDEHRTGECLHLCFPGKMASFFSCLYFVVVAGNSLTFPRICSVYLVPQICTAVRILSTRSSHTRSNGITFFSHVPCSRFGISFGHCQSSCQCLFGVHLCPGSRCIFCRRGILKLQWRRCRGTSHG